MSTPGPERVPSTVKVGKTSGQGKPPTGPAKSSAAKKPGGPSARPGGAKGGGKGRKPVAPVKVSSGRSWGPIAVNGRRWLWEGYATYVEGRLTGTGRPHGVWRASLLRQLALEGQLPTYGALDATSGYKQGSHAYLVGSAYLEWLAGRYGDSTLVHLWRRMTANTTRSLDVAFAGVYGASPAELYGRFTAELTASAMMM